MDDSATTRDGSGGEVTAVREVPACPSGHLGAPSVTVGPPLHSACPLELPEGTAGMKPSVTKEGTMLPWHCAPTCVIPHKGHINDSTGDTANPTCCEKLKVHRGDGAL